jgi:hypothetical protein
MSNNFLDSGYFYAPYLPITKTPVVLDPANFNPTRGILTRYGKKLLNEGSTFYDNITIGSKVKPSPYRSIDEDWEISNVD